MLHPRFSGGGQRPILPFGRRNLSRHRSTFSLQPPVPVPSSTDVLSESVPATERQRVSSLAVLHDVLASASESSVAAQLHVSVRSLRRYAAGEIKMNWVTHTRLLGMAAELESKRAAELEVAAQTRVQAPRKRERVSGSYPRVAAPAVALT